MTNKQIILAFLSGKPASGKPLKTKQGFLYEDGTLCSRFIADLNCLYLFSYRRKIAMLSNGKVSLFSTEGISKTTTRHYNLLISLMEKS